MYTVLIEGGDPFIAKSLEGVLDTLFDLFGGGTSDGFDSSGCSSIEWIDDIGDSQSVKVIKCEVYE